MTTSVADRKATSAVQKTEARIDVSRKHIEEVIDDAEIVHDADA